MNEETNTAKKPSLFARPVVQSITGIIAVLLILGGALYWKSATNKISIEKSQITAPTIAISPETSGTLDEVYVHTGDTVAAHTPLARVGGDILTSSVSGIVISAENSIGATYAPGQAVVSMINPDDLRVVGTIEEDKGLADIKVGQPATFTVDAFGSETFTGIVDSISPTSNESGVAFSISDKRETRQFDVKVRFDTAAHSEFKNGMSAKITIYKQF